MRFTKIVLASASLAFAFSSTTAQAFCQPGSAGCVLPLPGPVTSAPVYNPPAEPLVGVEEEGGFNFLPYLLALAALGVGAYFLLDDDGDVVSP